MPRTCLLFAVATLAMTGCREAGPAANRLDAANNRLADGVATTEGERALRETIRIGRPRSPDRPPPPAVAAAPAAGETCVERFGETLATSNDWAKRLPPGFALPPGTRVTEAAGRDGSDCAIRIVSASSPGTDRAAIADGWARAAVAAGYDAGRTMRGADLVVAGTKGDAAYVAMIGAPAGGVVPVDWVWSKGG